MSIKRKCMCKNDVVHFTGALIGGEFITGWFSKAYVDDEYSNLVSPGEYPSNSAAFPQAVYHSFDGIAIRAGTRLIIWSGVNFTGSVVFDKTGPAAISNVLFKDYEQAQPFMANWPEPLQSEFPQSVRSWSNSNMREWSNGSCKIF